jgi:putative nucleotidyltransferase with HDIG domain
LTSIKKHDEHTFVHALNVAILVLMQAETLGFKRSDLNEIGVAALLHDVGKLTIPERVLKKDGKLSQEEIQLMKDHPVEGAKILIRTEGLTRLASVVAFEHHLRYDLAGYPPRDDQQQQTLASMLVNIADYYDACRSHRSYHKGLPPEEIHEDMVSKKGADFDPDLLDHFFSTIGVYPAGTLVLLDTKEVGMVVEAEPVDAKRPKVRLLCDTQKKTFDCETIVDLREQKEKSKEYKRTIIRSISPFDPENAYLVPPDLK